MTDPHGSRPIISVLAGTNGAGKSSVAGHAIREQGGEYFNPDEATRRILEANPGISLDEANAQGWLTGKRLLENAIARRLAFAFETTLGGNTIPALLEQAHSAGFAVQVLFVGLSSPELHIERVKTRVAKGGHDIPEAKIRERYHRSRENLIRLMPSLDELEVYDNSETSSVDGVAPTPQLILHAIEGVITETCEVTAVPAWAKPIFIEALRVYST